MANRWIRGAAAICALGLTGVTFAGVAHADETPTPTPNADQAPATPETNPSTTPDAGTAAQCTPEQDLSLINVNDFHGRLAEERPDTIGVIGEIEQLRMDAGQDNALVLSAGDNIGGSLFPSFALQDDPTIEILNAMEIDASAVGNHEFDRGYADLRERIDGGGDRTQAEFPYLGANVYEKGTTNPVLKEYEIFQKAGLDVAVIGAVTDATAGMVSPAGIADIEFGDPVEAVSRVADQLSDGDPANGEADVIIAEYHDGGPSSGDLSANMANDNFATMANETSAHVDAIFQAHTHQTYNYDAPVPGDDSRTRPIVQAASYFEALGHVVLSLDAEGNVCDYTSEIIEPSMTADEAVQVGARPEQAKQILDRTLKEASVIGSQVVGEATAPVTRASDADGNENRLAESTMTNMVAQQFKEVLGNDDANFIGVQNPGGTRADLDKGEITYEEAAGILPFANSLKTTELTGEQFKMVLEQQWQRDENGDPLVEGRPFLALGLSDNITYTYDESRPMDDRITGIWVDGEPMDMGATYTIGSGNFLIDGGDQFWEFANGENTRDTGRVDLEAWTEWLQAASPISPDFRRRGVSVTDAPDALTVGQAGTVSLGNPAEDAVAGDTLATASEGVPAPETVVATIGDVEIGTAEVVDGRVVDMELNVPDSVEPGLHVIDFSVAPTGTVAHLPMKINAGDEVMDPNKVDHFSYDESCAPVDGSREYTPGETYTFVACNADDKAIAGTEIDIYTTADPDPVNLHLGQHEATVTTDEQGRFQITIPQTGYIGAIPATNPDYRLIIGENPGGDRPIEGEPGKPGEPSDPTRPGLPETGR